MWTLDTEAWGEKIIMKITQHMKLKLNILFNASSHIPPPALVSLYTLLTVHISPNVHQNSWNILQLHFTYIITV